MESTTITAPAHGEQAATGPDDVIHIASWWQSVVCHRLARRVPVALCGVRLLGDLDRQDPAPGWSPACPVCLARNGGQPGDIYVPPSTTGRD